VRLQGAHAYDTPLDLFAPIVADRDDDRVLAGGWGVLRVLEHALDAQRREGRLLTSLGDRFRIEPRVMLAGRTEASTFEDRRLAVRARARPARKSACVHAVAVDCAVLSAFSSQPNSARPRILEPAATISEPAFKSPFSTPVCRSSTLAAASILPSSSP